MKIYFQFIVSYPDAFKNPMKLFSLPIWNINRKLKITEHKKKFFFFFFK